MSERSERAAFDELCFYTLAHASPTFLHQHAVDAFTAQRAGEETKPIGVVFALVGLHLHVERGFTGRSVQRVHRRLARTGGPWPALALPRERGEVTVFDVLAAPPGPQRDAGISVWCASVWAAYVDSRPKIVELLRARGVT